VTRWVSVGRVGRPHGLDGSFVVEDASDDTRRFQVGATVYVDCEPAAVVGAKRAGGRLVIKLDRPVARGTELAVLASQLPPLGEGEYYVFQLVGLAVEEEGGRPLGAVVDVAPGVVNDVLELDTGVALPLVEDCVLAVDLEAGRIVVASGLVGSE
jgi:16S rRNA processing protein RimM